MNVDFRTEVGRRQRASVMLFLLLVEMEHREAVTTKTALADFAVEVGRRVTVIVVLAERFRSCFLSFLTRSSQLGGSHNLTAHPQVAPRWRKLYPR